METSQFWNLLASSKLLSGAAIQQQSQRFSHLQPPPSAKDVADDLIKHKLISGYQAQLLLAGHDGPFHFGNYTITDRYPAAPLTGQFKAIHRPTSHPVLLEFWKDDSGGQFETWASIEQAVELLAQIDTPSLASTYESVAVPEYRFVVHQRPEGVTLRERIPPKSRLPWKDACTVFSQVATAIENLHQQELVAGVVSSDEIWISKSGLTQFRINLQPTSASNSANLEGEFAATGGSDSTVPTKASDWRGLGNTLLRVACGKRASASPPQSLTDEEKRLLNQYDVPAEMQALLKSLVSADSHGRIEFDPPVSEQLTKFSGRRIDAIKPTPSATLVSFKKSISQFHASPASPTGSIESFPDLNIAPVHQEASTGAGDEDTLMSTFPAMQVDRETGAVGSPSAIQANTTHRDRRAVGSKEKKRSSMVTAAISLILFASVLGVGIWLTSRPPVEPMDFSGKESGLASNPKLSSESLDVTTAMEEGLPAVADRVPVISQQIIADDRTHLWESPTLGPSLELVGIPALPKILMVVRPRALLAQDEGERLLRSLGPELGSMLERWQSENGVRLGEIEALTVSLHSSDQREYEWFVLCRLAKETDAEVLKRSWGNLQPAATPGGNVYWVSSERPDRAWLVINESNENIDSVRRFAAGPTQLIAEIADDSAGTEVTGGIAEIARQTDCTRHFNLLYLSPALFNDEGQTLMADRLSGVNRELAGLLPDQVQAGLVSLHLDQGTYLELRFLRAVDSRANELKERLENLFRDVRNRTTGWVASIPSSPYWEPIRSKFGLMLVDLFRNLRWGVEHGEIVANVWLPPMAAHNLIAAAELSISFADGAGAESKLAVQTTSQPTPQTLAELLKTKRDLNIANPPDLNLLMADLENEIRDDFPALPFPFKIRLMGTHLQAEGITQNQRPSELNFMQVTLGEILTSIMVSANPAKDISGPADPRCKLVWAIADDPEAPGQPILLITTRNAAEANQYELPLEFQTE